MMGALVNLLWLSTLISELSRLSVSERRITDDFMNAQHPLNLATQQSVIKLLSAVVRLQSPMLWIT
jgi:hypothetical protein